jgi:signal transduction histidine kinase
MFVDPQKRLAIIARAIETDGFVPDEIEYRRRDGSTFLSILYIRAVWDSPDRVAFLEGFVEDITERRRAEESIREAYDALEQRVSERTAELSAANDRLQELDRLKSQFLASMSHELRTPLNSIIGFTSLLRQGLSGPVNAEQKKQLDIVQTSSKHLLTLINDLLDVSRIEAGRADLEFDTFDFAAVLAEALRILKPMADRKGLETVAELPAETIPMTGDRKRTLQVLLNLVNNAIKFTEEGRVRIQASTEADRLRVVVSDTGIGIKAEHIGMLFEAFRQVDGSARRIYEGTGLGLYLCRKLLRMMGGEIHVESDYGVGSRFTFTMPLELAPEPPPDV